MNNIHTPQTKRTAARKNLAKSIIFTALIFSMTIIIGSTQQLGNQALAKSCNPHGCKGDFHWYTKEGHHHCFKGADGCIFFDYSGSGVKTSATGEEHY